MRPTPIAPRPSLPPTPPAAGTTLDWLVGCWVMGYLPIRSVVDGIEPPAGRTLIWRDPDPTLGTIITRTFPDGPRFRPWSPSQRDGDAEEVLGYLTVTLGCAAESTPLIVFGTGAVRGSLSRLISSAQRVEADCATEAEAICRVALRAAQLGLLGLLGLLATSNGGR